jgi:hypothetical protein
MSERDNDSRSPGVHRLVDMVVEEVSLVDRAANKRRYLLVKRSEDVADTDTDTAEADTDTDTDDTATETDESETDNEDSDDGEDEDTDESDDEKPADAGAGAANAAVVAALEAMSAAVETLASAQAKAVAAPKKKPPARGSGAADDEDGDETEEEAEDEDEDEDPAPPRRAKSPAKRRAKSDDPFAQMKAAIGRLEGIVSGKATRAKRGPASIDDVAKKLDAVTTTLSDLKKLVGGQGERIGRVEKNVGLPASRPVEGKGKKKAEGDAVSWPFDLNISVDRASVDKTVSFHD